MAEETKPLEDDYAPTLQEQYEIAYKAHLEEHECLAPRWLPQAPPRDPNQYIGALSDRFRVFTEERPQRPAGFGPEWFLTWDDKHFTRPDGTIAFGRWGWRKLAPHEIPRTRPSVPAAAKAADDAPPAKEASKSPTDTTIAEDRQERANAPTPERVTAQAEVAAPSPAPKKKKAPPKPQKGSHKRKLPTNEQTKKHSVYVSYGLQNEDPIVKKVKAQLRNCVNPITGRTYKEDALLIVTSWSGLLRLNEYPKCLTRQVCAAESAALKSLPAIGIAGCVAKNGFSDTFGLYNNLDSLKCWLEEQCQLDANSNSYLAFGDRAIFIDVMMDLYKSHLEKRTGVSCHAIRTHNINNARRDCVDRRRTTRILVSIGWVTKRLGELDSKNGVSAETQLKKEFKDKALYEHALVWDLIHPEFRPKCLAFSNVEEWKISATNEEEGNTGDFKENEGHRLYE